MPRYQQYLQNASSIAETAETQDKILAAARRLFLKKGFQATTVREIAQEAGVTLGLIPYYFKSKENLAAQIAYDILDRFYARIDYSTLGPISSGAKLYVNDLLIYEYEFANPVACRLFVELNTLTSSMERPSKTAQELQIHLIREYNLPVTAEENEVYMAALMGAEKQMVKLYYAGQLQLTPSQLVDLLFSNYCYNIGLPDQEIAKIITEGQHYYKLFRKAHPNFQEAIEL